MRSPTQRRAKSTPSMAVRELVGQPNLHTRSTTNVSQRVDVNTVYPIDARFQPMCSSNCGLKRQIRLKRSNQMVCTQSVYQNVM